MTDFDDAGLLAALLDAAVDAVVITDDQGRILRANRAASTLFGHDHAALTGANVTVLMPDAMAMMHDGFMAQHMNTGARAILDTSRPVEGLRADGRAIPLLLSVGRSDTAQGVTFVAIMRDLTDQRAMEASATRSQRMDAIGRMTGGIAHDFNNLLTVVIGNLELLSNADLSARQNGFLKDALAAAELGADLTARLTVFARSADTRAEAIDLSDQLEKALGLLRHTIGAHCDIGARVEPDLWTVSVDPTQLQTAILNLAMNAQDAMPEGGTLLMELANVNIDDTYVAQELHVAPGRYVRLSVSDTGHGMSRENQARALEPFFTTKPAGHGTGLGLSVVYGFVKQAGGHVTIYSEPGDGTAVSLYFPAIEAGRGMSDTAAKGQGAGIRQSAARTILVVEDDARLCALTEQRLTDLGFVCRSAGTADDAWAMVSASDDIDLVFTDLVMPGELSGYDLAKRIMTEKPQIPVLMTSGFSETVLKERWMGTELPILRKPYRQAELERAIYAVLEPQ